MNSTCRFWKPAVFVVLGADRPNLAAQLWLFMGASGKTLRCSSADPHRVRAPFRSKSRLWASPLASLLACPGSSIRSICGFQRERRRDGVRWQREEILAGSLSLSVNRRSCRGSRACLARTMTLPLSGQPSASGAHCRSRWPARCASSSATSRIRSWSLSGSGQPSLSLEAVLVLRDRSDAGHTEDAVLVVIVGIRQPSASSRLSPSLRIVRAPFDIFRMPRRRRGRRWCCPGWPSASW